MSDGKDNEMWRRIEDAFTPNSDEFKRTERELAKVRLEQDARLRADDAASATRKPRRNWGRVTTMAGAASVLVAALAWTGSNYVFPDPKNRTDYYGRSFNDAERKATNPMSQRDWDIGTTYMDGGHESAAHFLSRISCEKNEVGRAAAAALRRFGEGTITAELTDTRGLKVFAFEALDSVDVATRLRAIEQLEAFFGEAERVINACDESSERRAKDKAIMLKHIAKRKQQAREGTLPTELPPRERSKATRPGKQVAIPIPEEFLKGNSGN